MTSPINDLYARLRPTTSQIDTARTEMAFNNPGGADMAIVALVLGNKEFGIWTLDVTVEPVDGVWLAHSDDDDSVQAAVQSAIETATVRLGDRTGTISVVTVEPDGGWDTFEELPSRPVEAV